MLSLRQPCSNCKTAILSVTAAITGGLCIPRSRKRRHFSKEAVVLADQSLWSEASKRSRSYDQNGEAHYYDEYYWCEQCEAPCVFTAADQKQAYEVEKRYLHQTRKLCRKCYETVRSNRVSGS